MSNLKNSLVACQYIFQTDVECQKAQCRMLNLRKGSVALSIVRVMGHENVERDGSRYLYRLPDLIIIIDLCTQT